LKYHVIWCTKYRYKILRGRVAERARDLIRQICESGDIVIVRGAVSPDHVHLLLSAPPVLAPAKVAQYIKGRSSRHLQAEFPELRKRYWGQASSGTKTIKALKSPRPPSLQPALSRNRLQTASAAPATFSRRQFYRLSAGSCLKASWQMPSVWTRRTRP
jgi:REP element-mobilizing transposase RayT